MLPLISIIIPVYNQAESLALVLESIKNQTYQNLEVIVVDDGSNQIINPKSEIINQLHRQENKGAPAARNKGFQLSQGELVIFWDADVIGEPEMIEKMQHVLTLHPEASYVYCNFILENNKKIECGKFDAEKLKQNNYICTMSLIRREDFCGFDESLKRFQDWDLWLTMLEKDKIGIWIPEYLFRIVAKGKISTWLPKFAYKKPWRWLPGVSGKVVAFEKAKEVVMRKHGLKLE